MIRTRSTQGIHLETDKRTSADIALTFTGGNFGGVLVELLGA